MSRSPCPRRWWPPLRLAGHLLAAAAWLGAGWWPGPARATGAHSWSWRGRLEASARYNSNLSLLSAAAPVPVKAAPLAEFGGRFELAGRAAGWEVEAQASGLANLHTEHTEENWSFGQGRLALRRPAWGGTVEVADDARWYTVPRRDTFDFVRHIAFAGWRRSLAPGWQLRTGYQGIRTDYPNRPRFDYTVHGLLGQLRTRWRPGLSTRISLDLQRYSGQATPQDAAAEASPQDGVRVTARLGLDWIHGRHVLSGTYSLQQDEADLGVQQIGDFEGPEGSQDIDAEFDLLKHRATLLYSVPLSRRWLLSAYAEWIRKLFDDEERPVQPQPRRTDTLWLWATHLRYRLDDKWAVKLRYLYRANRSSIGLLDYDNHLVSIGLERRR